MKIRFEKLEIEIDETLVSKIGSILLSLEAERTADKQESDKTYNSHLMNVVREFLPVVKDLLTPPSEEPMPSWPRGVPFSPEPFRPRRRTPSIDPLHPEPGPVEEALGRLNLSREEPEVAYTPPDDEASGPLED